MLATSWSCFANRIKPMTTSDWWSIFDEHRDVIRTLVAKYHPTSGRKHNMPISAAGAEAACEAARNRILKDSTVPGIVRFDAAVQSRNVEVLISLLNDAWFGMPESMSVRSEAGFHQLCDLCEGVDDAPVEQVFDG
jgi:hypothetical protein